MKLTGRSAISQAVVVAVLVGLAARRARADDALPAKEREKIEALVKAVEDLKDAKFVRNGAEYDGKAAADRMRRKWKKVEKDVHTARDFIRLAATHPIENDKPYLIRFKDGREVESAKFLAEKLDKMETGAAPANP